MTAADESLAPVVSCPECDGMTFILNACECRRGGNKFVVDDKSMLTDREPYQDCELCAGSGSIAGRCHGCDGTGDRRAQLVLTVANVDLGTVASVNLVPGGLGEPVLHNDGLYAIDLNPLLSRLGEQVNATAIYDGVMDRRVDLGSFNPLFLPVQWRPGLAPHERLVLETHALVQHCRRLHWRFYHARTNAPAEPTARQVLAQLSDLANLICLDLVIETRCEWGQQRPTSWDVRLEPAGSKPSERFSGLPGPLESVLGYKNPNRVLECLITAQKDVPAHWILPKSSSTLVSPCDVDALEVAMTACATGRAGAIATWRDSTWHITALAPVGELELLSSQATGQVTVAKKALFAREQEPPPPSYWAATIPQVACEVCASGTIWEECWCIRPSLGPDEDCETCHGAGVHRSDRCRRCGNTRAIRSGAVVTVFASTGLVQHINWRAGDPTATHLFRTEPNGTNVLQLDPRYRLSALATSLGIDPAGLEDIFRGSNIEEDLQHGLVTMHDPDTDPLTTFLEQAGHGHPGARVLLRAPANDTEPIVALLNVICGLGFACEIVTRYDPDALPAPQTCWKVDVVDSGEPFDDYPTPTYPTLDAAAHELLDRIGNAIFAKDYHGPLALLAAPQQPTAPHQDLNDIQQVLIRVARHYDGSPITVRFDSRQCDLRVGIPSTPDAYATAPTLHQAVTALLGPEHNDRQR